MTNYPIFWEPIRKGGWLDPRRRNPRSPFPTGIVTSLAVLGGAALAGLALRSSTSRGQIPGTVFTVLLENHDYRVLPRMQYLNWLAQQNASATNYRSSVHPSLPNYIIMTSGQDFGITDDTGHRISGTDNLAAQLDAARVPWRAYAESMSRPCQLGDTNRFARRHVPFLYYDSVVGNPQGCVQHVVPFTQFWADLASDQYRYMWITPDLCNDAHDCPPETADRWLYETIPRIQASPGYRRGGVIFITFDEGEGSSTLPMVVVSPLLRQAGLRDGALYSHKSYLATVEDLLGLPRLPATVGVAPMTSMLRL